jgi:hypothetical protein
MDGAEKVFLCVGAMATAIALFAIAVFAHGNYLRAQLLLKADDPFAVACAFDADGHSVPVSCITYSQGAQK